VQKRTCRKKNWDFAMLSSRGGILVLVGATSCLSWIGVDVEVTSRNLASSLNAFDNLVLIMRDFVSCCSQNSTFIRSHFTHFLYFRH
jgi:hypothetical protein